MTDSAPSMALMLMAAVLLGSCLLVLGEKGCVPAPDVRPNPAYAHELPETPIRTTDSGLHNLMTSAAGLTAASRSQSGQQRSLHLASQLLGQAAQAFDKENEQLAIHLVRQAMAILKTEVLQSYDFNRQSERTNETIRHEWFEGHRWRTSWSQRPRSRP